MSMKPYVSLAIALACCAAPATAQNFDGPKLPLWEAGIGVAAGSTPAYPGSSDRTARALALPFLIYRGEVIRADQRGIGARMVHNEAMEFDVGFSLSLPAKSDAVAARAGMPDLGTLIGFGPELKLNFSHPDPKTRFGMDLELNGVFEVNGGVRREGFTFEPKLVYAKRDVVAGWSGEAALGMVFGDAVLNSYFYEVQPIYASALRPTYQAKAGLVLTRASLNVSRHVGRDVRLVGLLRYEQYAGSANRDSPLLKKNSGTSVGLALAWTMARSQASARD